MSCHGAKVLLGSSLLELGAAKCAPRLASTYPAGHSGRRMRRAATLLPLASLMALSCASPDEDTDSWYTVATDLAAYRLIRANVDEDTCVLIVIAGASNSHEPEFDVTVNDNQAVYKVTVGPSAAECSLEPWQESADGAQGSITLDTFVDISGVRRACRMSVDLVVDLPDGRAVTFNKSDIPIQHSSCPEPNRPTRSIADVSASYGDGVLLVAGPEEETGGCLIYEFVPGEDPFSSAPAAPPEGWRLSRAYMNPMLERSCVAADIMAEALPEPTRMVTLWGLTGEVSSSSSTQTLPLGDGEVVVPCELDVDLHLEQYEHYYWAPPLIQMRSEGVVVDGACS